MLHGVVYRITNLETGKCYIGRTKRPLYERWYQHCNRSSNCIFLKHAITKYGKESFSIQEIASSWDGENLKELEALLIGQENTIAPNGYNLINNGHGISEISAETRDKLSKAHKGRCRGPFTEEHRRKLSRKKKGRPSLMKGKKFSDEARKNMGGQKGRKTSDETKAKQSISLKQLKWYTDGIADCRIKDGEPVPENFRLGRTKGLNNLPILINSWNDPNYRRHQSEVHKKKAA